MPFIRIPFLPPDVVPDDVLLDLHPGFYNMVSVLGVGGRYPPGTHIGIPDGFDLFKMVFFDDVIKGPKALIELIHQFLRRQFICYRGKALKIRKQNRNSLVTPG